MNTFNFHFGTLLFRILTAKDWKKKCFPLALEEITFKFPLVVNSRHALKSKRVKLLEFKVILAKYLRTFTTEGAFLYLFIF
jgi:hypothetical protein